MSETLRSPTPTRAEIDQRSREARRRLAEVEVLILPGIGATRSAISQFLYGLFLRPTGEMQAEPVADSRNASSGLGRISDSSLAGR